MFGKIGFGLAALAGVYILILRLDIANIEKDVVTLTENQTKLELAVRDEKQSTALATGLLKTQQETTNGLIKDLAAAGTKYIAETRKNADLQRGLDEAIANAPVTAARNVNGRTDSLFDVFFRPREAYRDTQGSDNTRDKSGTGATDAGQAEGADDGSGEQ